MKNKSYFSFIKPIESLATKKVLQVNPTVAPSRKEPLKTIISVYEYSDSEVKFEKLENVEDCYKYLNIKRQKFSDGIRQFLWL